MDDFLAKNRRAIRNIKPKAATASVKDSMVKGPLRPQPPTAKPTVSQKKAGTVTKPHAPLQSSTLGSGNGGKEDGTVVISKDYLDNLLKMSVLLQAGVEGGRRGEGEDGQGGDQTVAKTEAQSHHRHHISVSPSSIPGLGNNNVSVAATSASTYQQPHPWEQLEESTTRTSAVHAGRTTVGRAKRGRTISPTVAEDYFPFGRPGCGAPLRTASGQVMADLRRGGQNPHHPPMSTHLPPVFTHHKTQGGHLQQAGSIAGTTTSHAHIPEEPRGQPLLMMEGHGVRSSGGDLRLSGGGVGEGMESCSPRYARGAGPHVDQYMLRERAEKRKKQMEHVVRVRESSGIIIDLYTGYRGWGDGDEHSAYDKLTML